MPPKALLLVDNCSAHGTAETPNQSIDKNICVFYLPPNTTPILQPMDQSPIKVVKMKYRKILLSKIISEKDEPISNVLKKHTIKDAIVYLQQAWEQTSDIVLKNSWNPFWRHANDFNQENDDDSESDDNESNSESEPEDSNETVIHELIRETNELLNEIGPDSGVMVADIEMWNEDEVDTSSANIESDDDDSEFQTRKQSIT